MANFQLNSLNFAKNSVFRGFISTFHQFCVLSRRIARMVDVLSWLQTDHGYYGDSDLFSSESSSPGESDTGENHVEPFEPVGSPFLPFNGNEDWLSSLFEDQPNPSTALSDSVKSHSDNLGSWLHSQPLPGKYLPRIPSEDKDQEGSVDSTPRGGGKVKSTASVSVPFSVKSGSGMTDPLMERNRKNAEAARLNRQKKKQYLQSVESELQSLREENKTLKSKCGNYESAFKRLTQEIEYLRSVIQNQSTLSTLLKNIPNTGGVRLDSSLSRKRSPPRDVSLSENSPKQTCDQSRKYSGGVCLHVAKDNVCIEFCSHCSENAAQSFP